MKRSHARDTIRFVRCPEIDPVVRTVITINMSRLVTSWFAGADVQRSLIDCHRLPEDAIPWPAFVRQEGFGPCVDTKLQLPLVGLAMCDAGIAA